jgi:hypothetical protein
MPSKAFRPSLTQLSPSVLPRLIRGKQAVITFYVSSAIAGRMACPCMKLSAPICIQNAWNRKRLYVAVVPGLAEAGWPLCTAQP